MPENIDTTGSPMPNRADGEPIAGDEPGRFQRRPSDESEQRRFVRREPRDVPVVDRPIADRGVAGTPAAERGVAGEPAATGSAAERRRRRGPWRRRRSPVAAAAGTLGAGILAIARLVMAVATLIALLIVLAIVLRDVDANASNSIVKGIHEGANFFAGSFNGLIKFNGHYKRAITINWGIAAIAYLLVGALIAGLISRVGRSGIRFERDRSTAPLH